MATTTAASKRKKCNETLPGAATPVTSISLGPTTAYKRKDGISSPLAQLTQKERISELKPSQEQIPF